MMSRLNRVLSGVGRAALGMVLVLVLAAGQAGLFRFPLGEALDRFVHDMRLRGTHAPVDPRIVIVDIDEASLGEFGRWPWPREVLARLITRLTREAGAAVVGVDIVFAEHQREDGHDDRLARAIGNAPVVLGYYFTSDRGGRTSGLLPEPVMRSDALPPDLRPLSWDGYGAPIAPLQRAARGAGFFNPVIDPDGVVRALPLLGEYRGGLYESLSVGVLREYLGAAAIGVVGDDLVIKGTRGTVRIPMSAGLTALVPFATVAAQDGPAAVEDAKARGAETRDAEARGPGTGGAGAGSTSGRFRYVSAADVVAGRVDPAVFEDRIVLVGTSAPGLTDLRATPLSAAFPGVEIHAGLLSGALDQAQRHPIKVRSPLADTGMLALLLVLGGVLAAAMPMLGAPGVLGLGALSASGVWIAGAVAWSHHGVLLPVAVTLLAVAALTLLNLSLGYLIEGRARRAVAGLFGEYVSPALVERMMRDPQRYSRASSENRELTILFVDIRGFTRIAETMEPEALREYINVFLTVMTEIVHRHGGTLDKYIGDAVMAFWGAPLEDARHADHAVAAAIAMLEAVERLNTMLAGRGMPPLRIGVGVNTGVVRVGDLGSRLRRAYTVIGDPVNLAARFEGLTRQYDAPIIVGETTMRQAVSHRFRALGSARVAGREEPVLIYAPESVAAGSPSCGNHSAQDDPATDPGASTGQALADEGTGLRL